jgi:Putative zinc-finger
MLSTPYNGPHVPDPVVSIRDLRCRRASARRPPLRREPSSAACEHARSRISLALDGALSRFERAKLDAHLAHCVACRTHETETVAFTDLVRTPPLQPFSTSIIVRRRRRPSLLTLQVGGTAATPRSLVLASSSALPTPITRLDRSPESPGRHTRPHTPCGLHISIQRTTSAA